MQVQTANATSQVVPAFNKPVKAVRQRERKQLSRVNLRTFIESMGGKFLAVDYRKLDGAPRTITGRRGVKAFLKGGSNKVEAQDRPYIVLFDVQLLEYRTVNLDTVSELRTGGAVYTVV